MAMRSAGLFTTLLCTVAASYQHARVASPRACIVACAADDHLAKVADWIKASGGDVSRVRIGEVDGMRGGAVKSELPPLQQEQAMKTMAAEAAVAVTAQRGVACRVALRGERPAAVRLIFTCTALKY